MNTQIDISTEAHKTAKKFTFAAYILYFVGTISLGVFSLIGLMLCYTRRKDLQDTIFYNHLSYLIKTFWIFFVLNIIGFLLVYAKGIGIIILILNHLWYLYRLVSGFTKLSDNRNI